MRDQLSNFFENYINKEGVFKDKKALQSSFFPDEIAHRDEQINTIANILAPSLKRDTPSNLFIYGKTGTGKTLSVKYVSERMKKIADEKEISLKIIYVNCKLKKVADTEYRIVAELSRSFGRAIPATGLPTDEVYKLFFQSLDQVNQNVIIVLDEVDQLVKKAGDEIIYNLTRINSELKNSSVSIVGISNDLLFTNNIDPRAKSSLSEEEIVFPPYNAIEIKDILTTRAKIAFKESVLAEGVISKCAAYAAREHGDARRALELLRVAGELAEREESKSIDLKYIDEAEDKIERDRMLDIVKTQPKQFQATLYSVLLVEKGGKKSFFTGDVYDNYKIICSNAGLRPLTQRRVSDILAELDMLGMITARVVSKGRFGRTREISVSIPNNVEEKILKLLEEGLNG